MIHVVLGGLSRHFGQFYDLHLLPWWFHDPAFTAPLKSLGVKVHDLSAETWTERLKKVEQAIAEIGIDVLITDINYALPTVVFERRAARVQIFYQLGMPFWPVHNVDGA